RRVLETLREFGPGFLAVVLLHRRCGGFGNKISDLLEVVGSDMLARFSRPMLAVEPGIGPAGPDPMVALACLFRQRPPACAQGLRFLSRRIRFQRSFCVAKKRDPLARSLQMRGRRGLLLELSQFGPRFLAEIFLSEITIVLHLDRSNDFFEECRF